MQCRDWLDLHKLWTSQLLTEHETHYSQNREKLNVLANALHMQDELQHVDTANILGFFVTVCMSVITQWFSAIHLNTFIYRNSK